MQQSFQKSTPLDLIFQMELSHWNAVTRYRVYFQFVALALIHSFVPPFSGLGFPEYAQGPGWKKYILFLLRHVKETVHVKFRAFSCPTLQARRCTEREKAYDAGTRLPLSDR